MKLLGMALGIIALLAGYSAGAERDTNDPELRARLSMKDQMREHEMVLHRMALNEAPFDLIAARRAVAEVGELARQIEPLFGHPIHDPASRARPEIWENFEDFTARAADLAAYADWAIAGFATIEDGIRIHNEIERHCQGCHALYRE